MKRTRRGKLNLNNQVVDGIISVIGITLPTILITLSFDSEESNYIFVIIASLICLILTTIFVFLKLKNKHKEIAEYDAVRESVERDIIRLQLKLAKTNSQWKASNYLALSKQLGALRENDESISNLAFLQDLGLKSEDYTIDHTLVFYLSSFSLEFSDLYQICKQACSKQSMKLVRADEEFSTGDIFTQIVKYIVKASLIIVNIDGKNPNVFYELGIAHALGKRVMIISKRNNDVPFDVRQYRILFYNDYEDLSKKLPEAIAQFQAAIRKELEKQVISSFYQLTNNYSDFFSQSQKIKYEGLDEITKAILSLSKENFIDRDKISEITQSFAENITKVEAEAKERVK